LSKNNQNAVVKSSAQKTERVTSPSIIITLIAAAIILTGVIIWAVFAKQANSLENKVAMKVDDTEVSGLEFQYNYWLKVNEFLNTYGSYASLFGLDTSKALDEQEYYDGQTWADYFRENTITSLKEVNLLYNDGIKNGYSISDEDKSSAKQDAEDISDYFKGLGYDPDAYLASGYGKGMTISKYEEYTAKQNMVVRYYNDLMDSFDFGSSDYENYYNENKQSMDKAIFRSYLFSYETVEAVEADEEAGIVGTSEEDANMATEANKTAAQINADNMNAALTDEASFEDYLVNNVFLDSDFTADSTLSSGTLYSALATEVGDWLFDSARVDGDHAVVEVSNGFYVLWFKSCGLDKYNTVNMRHIYLSKDTVAEVTDENGETDTEATAAAQAESDEAVKTNAEEIYNEWKNGEATEDSFAALADEKSVDTSMEGGLYSQVTNDYFSIAEINEWLFDSARKSGDTTIVESSYGFHILYFVGEDAPAWELEVDETLTSDAYNEYVAALEENANIQVFEDVTSSIS